MNFVKKPEAAFGCMYWKSLHESAR